VLTLICSAVLGIYGYLLSMGAVAVSILSLESFGFDATPALALPKNERFKDTVIRAQMWKMRTRPPITSNEVRLGEEESEE
jgi:hypothetical protein